MATDQNKIWEYYQNVAPKAFELSRPRLDFLLRRLHWKSRAPDPKVLNIGGGDGYFEERAVASGCRVASLDPDQGVVSRLRAEGIESRRGSIAELPFPSASFDFVVTSEVLEHLEEEVRAQGLREVARVLKQDGWFLGTVPYNEQLNDFEVVCPACGELFHRWGHLKSFTLKTIHDELAPYFTTIQLKRTAFIDFRNRSLLGMVKALARLMLAKYGVSIASPTLYFAATPCQLNDGLKKGSRRASDSHLAG